MNFIQTGFLLGGLAVAIPVLVHLLSRWQVRRVELGTMRFLQEVIQDGSQRRKIRRWLLLLTRMAAVAALVILFARPYLSEWIRRDGDRVRVILIDRSASMGMPGQNGRLIDDAVAKASEVAGELGTDATVLWAWFDREVEPFETNAASVVAPRSVVGDTNYLAALSWARDRIDASPDAAADVVLISDLQQSGLASDRIEDAALQLSREIPVDVIDVGRPAANNLALQSVVMRSKRFSPRRPAVADVTLFNFGTLPMEEIPLTATAGNGRRTVRLKKSINIPGGQAQEVSFDFGSLEPGIWQVTVQMDVEDDLAVDNRRLTAFEVADAAEVLVLDGGLEGEAGTAQSFYLQAALDQSTIGRNQQDEEAVEPGLASEDERSEGTFRSRVVFLSEESLPVLQPNDPPVVIVANCASMDARSVAMLRQYVEAGGRLVVFAGQDPFSSAGQSSNAGQWRNAWSDSGLSPGEFESVRRSGAMPFRIGRVETDHLMLRPFGDPQQGDLARLAFERIQPVRLDESTEVLARFEQGDAALTRHRLGRGRVVWFLSSADGSWGNWTTSPLYLPLVQQMAADMLNLTGEGRIRYRSVGDQFATAPPRQDQASPNGKVVPVSVRSAARASLPRFDRPGFQEGVEALYVVNAPSKESDPARISRDRFAEHFQIRLAETESAEEVESVQGEHRRELWPWVAALAFVLLTAEFALANRTSA